MTDGQIVMIMLGGFGGLLGFIYIGSYPFGLLWQVIHHTIYKRYYIYYSQPMKITDSMGGTKWDFWGSTWVIGWAVLGIMIGSTGLVIGTVYAIFGKW